MRSDCGRRRPRRPRSASRSTSCAARRWSVGSLEEMIDDNHAHRVGCTPTGTEYYASASCRSSTATSCEPGCSVLLHQKTMRGGRPAARTRRTRCCQCDEGREGAARVVRRHSAASRAAGAGDQGGRRAAADAPRALRRGRHQAAEGRDPVRSCPARARRCSPRRWPTRRRATFLRVVGSELIQKYLGRGAEAGARALPRGRRDGAVDRVHRRDRRRRHEALRLALSGGEQRGAAHDARAAQPARRLRQRAATSRC
jgi:hypothetical protein